MFEHVTNRAHGISKERKKNKKGQRYIYIYLPGKLV
jgi:hypothetical protein